MDYIMIGPYQFDRDASKDDMRLDYCSSFQEVALDESSLSFDTVSVEVCTKTIGTQLSALPNNTPIIVYRGGEIKARFVSSGVSRIGPVTYQFTGRSPMGALTGMVHTGGIYTGQTVEEVVKEICGNILSLIKSVYAGVKLYGWLPYADGKERSARDNLAQVLFAIGAYLRTDLNGVLRIEPLWDGTASLIDVDRSYTGGTVKYDSPISAVTVTEHQYVAGTEVKELFSGTAQNGDIITFSEPMHSLSATGFTILESGANYAKISAGAGALTGKAYIHNTRLITQPVTAGAVENIKSVTDATLVSLVNSYAVAKRLADYYRCRETITNDIVSGHEKPGHVVSVYHPYDKKMVSACIQSLDTTMSATLKSSMEALVGFVPPQPDTAEYLDERVILTDAGTWTMPEGAVTLRVVLIGKGSDGTAGNPGDDNMLTSSTRYNTSSATFSAGAAGKGGSGGIGGDGGKINIITLEPEAGQTFAYDTTGDEVTFGTYSSADGAASEAGYFDSTTLEYFGRKGADGVSGGDGGAVGASGKSVGDYFGGHGTESKSIQHKWTASGTTYTDRGSIQGFGGGGAAKGRNGLSANGYIRFQAFGFTPDVSVNSDADGASGSAGDDGANYGDGGGGGNGGGGAGATGSVSVSFTPSAPSGERTQCSWSGVWVRGGSGGAAGAGKKGCVILYYRRPKAVQSGPLATADGKWLLDKLGRRMIV
jgi:hypothetical protein